AVNSHAQSLAQILARDRPCGYSHHGLARRGAPAAAVIAQTIFLLVGVVRVSWTEAVLDLFVVARALILVLDQQADRRPGGASIEDARQDAHLIRLTALTRVARRARAAPLDIRLDIRLRQRHPRRAAIDDATERRPMAFAEGRDGEEFAESVAGHGDG